MAINVSTLSYGGFLPGIIIRCIERYCMTHRQRDDDNNLSVGNRNHLKLGIESEF